MGKKDERREASLNLNTGRDKSFCVVKCSKKQLPRRQVMPKYNSVQDVCKQEACNIQKCLREKSYKEESCQDIIEKMRMCCQKEEAKHDLRCSGFTRQKKQ